MQATITFETVTEESAEQGDFADHGWIAPNEYRVSLGNAGRNYGKRVRMSAARSLRLDQPERRRRFHPGQGRGASGRG
jgi:hypothetical protein